MHANVSNLFISHKNPKLCSIVYFCSGKIVKLTTHDHKKKWRKGNQSFPVTICWNKNLKHYPSPATCSSCWENSVWLTMVTNTWFNSKAKSSSTTSMITATQNKPFALATVNYVERKGRWMPAKHKWRTKCRNYCHANVRGARNQSLSLSLCLSLSLSLSVTSAVDPAQRALG